MYMLLLSIAAVAPPSSLATCGDAVSGGDDAVMNTAVAGIMA